MSYYTEKNALAKFWNRDHTRLEWAKWVFHHPEQTEALIDRLLRMPNHMDLTSIQNRLKRIEQITADQATQITQLLVAVQQVDNNNLSPIAMEQLVDWLAQNPVPDGFIQDIIEAIPMEQLIIWLAQNPTPDGITQDIIEAIPMDQLIEWLAQNPIPDGISETQLQALLELISRNDEIDVVQQQQIDSLLNTGSITQEQLEELLEQTSDDDLSNVTAITKEQLDELLNEKGEDD